MNRYSEQAQRSRQRNRGLSGALFRGSTNQGENKMLKYVLPLALLVGATAPAFAAEFYIVRGSDKKCTIVETRPSDKTVTVIGDKAYATRDEATKQRAVVCKS